MEVQGCPGIPVTRSNSSFITNWINNWIYYFFTCKDISQDFYAIYSNIH